MSKQVVFKKNNAVANKAEKVVLKKGNISKNLKKNTSVSSSSNRKEKNDDDEETSDEGMMQEDYAEEKEESEEEELEMKKADRKGLISTTIKLTKVSGPRDRKSEITKVLEPAWKKWVQMNTERESEAEKITDDQLFIIIESAFKFSLGKDKKNNTGEKIGQTWIKTFEKDFPNSKNTQTTRAALDLVIRFNSEFIEFIDPDFNYNYSDFLRLNEISAVCSNLMELCTQFESPYRSWKMSHAFVRTASLLEWTSIVGSSWLFGLQLLRRYEKFVIDDPEQGGFFKIKENAPRALEGEDANNLLDYQIHTYYNDKTILTFASFPSLLRGKSCLTFKTEKNNPEFNKFVTTWVTFVGQFFNRALKAIKQPVTTKIGWSPDYIARNSSRIISLETTLKRTQRAIANHISGRTGNSIGKQRLPEIKVVI